MCLSFMKRWMTIPGTAERRDAAAETQRLLEQQQALAAQANQDPRDSEASRLTGEQRLRKMQRSGFGASFYAPRGGGGGAVAKVLMGQ